MNNIINFFGYRRRHLTDDMRAWIRAHDKTALVWDFQHEFRERYNLTPDEAGKVLAQWAKECW